MDNFKKVSDKITVLIIASVFIIFFQNPAFGDFMIYNEDNTKIYYEIHGKGRPLVLIAGLASDSQSWITVIPELSKHYKVVVFDNRTTGRTKSDEKELSIDLMADDALRLINHLNLSEVTLLGHSMGGLIALNAAAKNNNLIKNLIIAASPDKISEKNKELFSDWLIYLKNKMNQRLWFKNLFYWILTDQFFENKEILNAGLDYSVNYPFPQTIEGFEKQINALKNYRHKDTPRKITQRTLVLAPEKDRLFSVEECRSLSDLIKNAEFKIIKNAAHSIHSEFPAELCNEVFLFLD